MKLWGGRFTKETNKLVEEFNASISFDSKLAEYDLLGSVAHIKMLGHAKILPQEDVDRILQGLNVLQDKLLKNELVFSIKDEDIHMNIERLLHEEIGEVAGKLHTGRSRNDQVALDLHLYVRDQIFNMVEKLTCLQAALLKQAEDNLDTILPGYTHLQRAQPIRFAHHLGAYIAMLQRDVERFMANLEHANIFPLGAGALAGSGFAIDREYAAKLLGFDMLYENSIDAVSDRDYILEFLSNASIAMTHLSRLSEEIILWSSQEFAFITLDDAYCTGSSMMPQKKNPDIAELVRGKTGRVYGALLGLLTVIKGLPLAYNKDLQEDKEGLFDTVDTLDKSLILYGAMIETMTVNSEAMSQAVTQDFSNATQVADYLVAKGIPFREAHEITGKLVLHCIQEKIYLSQLPLTQYQTFHPTFDDGIFAAIQPVAAVEARSVRGGTGRDAVIDQLNYFKEKVSQNVSWVKDKHPSF